MFTHSSRTAEQQRLLGERMEQRMAEVQRAFSAFLERTMKDGRPRAP